MEALERGMWGYIVVVARAAVVVNGVTQTLSSGGLWGVESDSGTEYFAEMERNELAVLRRVLRGLGFSSQAITAAFNRQKGG